MAAVVHLEAVAHVDRVRISNPPRGGGGGGGVARRRVRFSTPQLAGWCGWVGGGRGSGGGCGGGAGCGGARVESDGGARPHMQLVTAPAAHLIAQVERRLTVTAAFEPRGRQREAPG